MSTPMLVGIIVCLATATGIAVGAIIYSIAYFQGTEHEKRRQRGPR